MLEDKNYVATEDDIAKLTQTIVAADGQASGGRASYLRVLVAVTQKELGAEVRQRTGKAARLAADETAKQLAALALVHERFYSVIVKVTGDSLSPGTKGRAVEINRLTNFARTAMSAIRSWVKAGNDITALAPAKVSKSSLSVTLRKAGRPSVKVLRNRTESLSKTLMSTVKTLSSVDKATAIEAIQATMQTLSDHLVKLGFVSTRKIAPAMKMLMRPLPVAMNGNGAHTARPN